MSRARQVANFDPALFAADEVSGDKVSGGTIGAGVIGASVTGGAGLTGSTSLGTVTVGDISHADIVYPTGHVVFQYYAESSAGANITIDGGWHSVTNQTITIPAADVNKCSSLVILWNYQPLIYRGSTHHFGETRIARTAPGSLVPVGKSMQSGHNLLYDPTQSDPIYDTCCLCVRDSSLVSDEEHVYALQGTSTTSNSGNFNPAQTGANITVWGFK